LSLLEMAENGGFSEGRANTEQKRPHVCVCIAGETRTEFVRVQTNQLEISELDDKEPREAPILKKLGIRHFPFPSLHLLPRLSSNIFRLLPLRYSPMSSTVRPI